MNCPICLEKLSCYLAAPQFYRYYCDRDNKHTIIDLDRQTGSCSYYNVRYNNKRLEGNSHELANCTFIIDLHTNKFIINTSWIPIEVNNLPEDIPALINRLLKLKCFL